MKKKFISILCILALVITMMPAAAMTAYGAINIPAKSYDGIQWAIKEGVLYISKGTASGEFAAGEMGDADMYGYKAWASYKDEITKVVVEEGVTRLGFEACADMPLLQSAEIAASVEAIGSYAFAGNQALESVIIKDGTQSIGEYAFYNCTALKEINIPASVKSIGQLAFQGCTGMTKVTLQEGLEAIGTQAFSNCTSLTDIAFPTSVKTVGVDALAQTPFVNAQAGNDFLTCGSTLLKTTCSDFYAVDGHPCVIPAGIVCIAEKAFYDVEITELEFPNSLRYIGNYAFAGGMRNDYQCIMKATNIEFKNVEYIGTNAFEYSHYLSDVKLPYVTYLGDGAFYWSNHMKTVELASNMEYLGNGVFSECHSITSITGPEHVKLTHYNALMTGGSTDDVIYADVVGDGYTVYHSILFTAKPKVAGDEIVIPEGVTTIANRALDSFNESTVMRVPESVTTIAESYSLWNITDIYYAGDMNGWNAIYIEKPENFANTTIHYAKQAEVTPPSSGDSSTGTGGNANTGANGGAANPTPTPGTPAPSAPTPDSGGNGGSNSGANGGTAQPAPPTEQHQHSYAQTITKATAAKDGKIEMKCSCGDVQSVETIAKASKTKLSISSYLYNGKKKAAPKVIVKDSKGKTIPAANYTVTKPKKVLKAIGNYTYTIKFKGDLYTDTKKLTLTIKPAKPTIKAPTAAKKAVTVKWKAVKKARASGYQVMISTNKKFTKNTKQAFVKGYSKTSCKATKLKAKKTYYVKVRTYKTVKGVKVYSDWSKVKQIKTK